MPDSKDSQDKIDLSGLQMMPDWVTNLDKGESKPARPDFPEETESKERKGGRGGGDRHGGGGRGFDRGGRQGGGGGYSGGNDRGGRGGGGGGYQRDRQGGGGRGRDRDRRGGDRRDREPMVRIPDGVEARVVPSVSAIETLTQQIRTSGRSLAMFDLAKAVMGGRERFDLEFRVTPEAKVKFFHCKPDGALFLSREEAMRHLLTADALKDTYQVENTEVEPPKGEFKAVAVCGMSGKLLGPPNHHSYQTAVLRLHRQRFANMPLERFKARIRTESDEELVEKWKESVSKTTTWLYPKEVAEGEEQLRLETEETLERHFSGQVASGLIEEGTHARVSGNVPAKSIAPGLLMLLRRQVDEVRRSPFPLVRILCSELEKQGLKIFKRQGKKLFVARNRPRPLDPDTELSDSIRNLIEVVQAQPGIKVSAMVTSLAPRAKSTVEEPKEGELTPEEISVLSDLRWLVGEGFILEYASGALHLGGRPRKEGEKKKKKAKSGKEGGKSEGKPAGRDSEEKPAEVESKEAEEPKEEEAKAPPSEPEAEASETASSEESPVAEDTVEAPEAEATVAAEPEEPTESEEATPEPVAEPEPPVEAAAEEVETLEEEVTDAVVPEIAESEAEVTSPEAADSPGEPVAEAIQSTEEDASAEVSEESAAPQEDADTEEEEKSLPPSA